MKENVSGCSFLNTVYIPNVVEIGKTFCGRMHRHWDRFY